MIIAGNPGIFILMILYLFFLQPFLILCGYFFEKKRAYILYTNVIVGLLPHYLNLKILYGHYIDGHWWKDDYVYMYIAVCGVINVLIGMLSLFFQKENVFSYWWLFFTWCAVFGSIFLAFISNFIILGQS